MVLFSSLWSQVEIDGFHLDYAPDSSAVLIPENATYENPRALLVLLNCKGGTVQDIYTNVAVAETLRWFMASCKGPRNHRETALNEHDILNLVQYLCDAYPVDTNQVYIFGFSGMGAQALATACNNPMRFAGVISTCGHNAGLQDVDWDKASSLKFYLITREKDWNRVHNENLNSFFQGKGIRSWLLLTPGEHQEGPPQECYNGCRWMYLTR